MSHAGARFGVPTPQNLHANVKVTHQLVARTCRKSTPEISEYSPTFNHILPYIGAASVFFGGYTPQKKKGP